MIVDISNTRKLAILKDQSEDLTSVISELGDKIDALLKQQASLAVVQRAIENEADRIRSIQPAEEAQLELNFDA
jgi:hypothetical protein